jgi:electron transport complex protein RnfG
MEIDLTGGKKEKILIYRAVSDSNECVGWCFNAAGTGFSGRIELVVATDRLLEKIAGFDVLTSSETPGFGDKIKTAYFRTQFAGAPAGNLNLAKTGNPAVIDSEIVAITGATVSSTAVVNILNNYLSKIKDQMTQKELITNGR